MVCFEVRWWLGFAVALLTIWPPAVVGQPQPPSTMPDPADQLPAPKIEPGDVPRACAASGSRRAESDAAGRGVSMLRSWGRTHFKFPGSCTDWDFVISKWQQTVGHPVTGVATEADGERLREELRKRRPQFQEAWAKFEAPRVEAQSAARDAERRRQDDLPKTAVDFLPQGSNLADTSCGAMQQRISAQVRQETSRRIAALPPGAVTSGRTEAIEREVTAQATAVAPEWRALWTRQPVLVEWAEKFGCRRVLRFAVEYWQTTIGVAAEARDPSAIGRTEQVIAKAQDELRAFQADQAGRFRAEAQESGETARARSWALDEVSGKTTLAAATSQLPTALCAARQQTVSCARAVLCEPEGARLRSANAALQGAKLTRPLNDTFWAPSSALMTAVRDAQDAVKRCEGKSAYGAAANSRVSFAGLDVLEAELLFGERGLAVMKLRIDGDTERARMLLTQRYRPPESQQETRTRLVTIPTVGGTAEIPGAGTVAIMPGVAQMPQQYSVTRYVWKAPSVLVEESGGSFTFRFESR